MEDYQSNATLADLAADLHAAQRVIITTHAKPDGDAIGSAAALAYALKDLGKQVECWFMGPLLDSLTFIADGLTTRVIDDEHPVPMHDESCPEPDVVVVVDTGAWSQLAPLKEWLEPRREKTLGLDHHLRGDDVAAKRVVDTSAAAACEVVAELIDTLKVPFTLPIAQALYLGIASDTGWFRFSNTRAQTLELAGRLKRIGVDHAAIHASVEQRERTEKLALIQRALASITYHAGGRAAVMQVRSADFAETGARPEETERIIDMPQVVSHIEVVILMTEMPNGAGTKMSLRSKPVENFINVSDLAQPFGGGGHAHAAGARTDDSIDATYVKLIEAIESAYKV